MASPTAAKQNILEIEKSIGIWWPRGLSRQKDGRKIPAIAKLLKEFERITQRYGCFSQREIRRSEALRLDASTTFHNLGQEIWPDAGEDRSAWLVSSAEENSLGGLYPKDLYFSDAKDRQKLHDLFQELVVAKCIRYYENHGRHWHYEVDQAGHQLNSPRISATGTEQQQQLPAGHTEWRGSTASMPRPHPSPPNEGADTLAHGQDRETLLLESRFRPHLGTSATSESDDTPMADHSPAMDASSISPAPIQIAKQTAALEDATLAGSRDKPTHIASSASGSTPRAAAVRGSITRSDNLPHEILGELIDSPSVVKILYGGHAREISQTHWQVLRDVLVAHPAARKDSALLHAELSKIEQKALARDYVTDGSFVTPRAVTAPMESAGRPLTRAPLAQHDQRDELTAVMLPFSRSAVISGPVTSMNSASHAITPPGVQSYQTPATGIPRRRPWPSADYSAPMLPRMNMWLRLKDARVRTAITLDRPVDVVEVFSIIQHRLAHKLNGRSIVALTFTHVGRSIEDDPIEVESRDQTTWEALLAMVIIFRGQEPVELKAVIDF